MKRKSGAGSALRSRESGNQVPVMNEPSNNFLPEGWKTRLFAEIADYQTGRTPARANPRYWTTDEHAHAWVSISDMQPHGLLTKTAERISQAAVDETFRGRVSKAGTLLMSFKLTIGRVATLGIDACHNEAIISIYPKGGINQKYLEYFLAQVDYTDYQDRAVKGHTLNQEKIDRIAVSLPPQSEQEAIAAVLWKVQRAIATQDRLIAATCDLRQSVRQRLLTRGLRGEQLKETEIGLMPEGWHPARVADCVTSYKFDRASQLPASAYMKSGKWPVIDQGQAGVAGFTNDDHRVHRPAAPVIIFGDHSRTLKYVEQPFVLGADGTKPLLARSGIDPAFLFHALQHLDIPSKGYSRHFKFLAESFIGIPGEGGEQCEIASALASIDRRLAHHERKRAVLDALFQTTLHQLMTAQVRVADLNIDTSEVTMPAVLQGEAP